MLALSFGNIAIAIVVILGIVAILYVVARAAGLPIPGWAWSILSIIGLVVVAVLAIKLLMGVV